MSLPYSYKKEIELPENENFETIVDKLKFIQNSSKLKNIEEKKNEFNFTSNKSLFGYSYNVDLKRTTTGLSYEFHLMELIKLILIIVVVLAFVSKFSVNGFLWFSGLFLMVFYIINVLYIYNKIDYLFKTEIFENLPETQKAENISSEQSNWIASPDKCPACGESITEYDNQCHECGLTIKGCRKIAPINITKFEDYYLKYKVV